MNKKAMRDTRARFSFTICTFGNVINQPIGMPSSFQRTINVPDCNFLDVYNLVRYWLAALSEAPPSVVLRFEVRRTYDGPSAL